MMLFWLVYTRASIRVPTLILFKVTQLLLCRQGYAAGVGRALRPCSVLCCAMMNFLARGGTYPVSASACGVNLFIFIIFSNQVENSSCAFCGVMCFGFCF